MLVHDGRGGLAVEGFEDEEDGATTLSSPPVDMTLPLKGGPAHSMDVGGGCAPKLCGPTAESGRAEVLNDEGFERGKGDWTANVAESAADDTARKSG